MNQPLDPNVLREQIKQVTTGLGIYSADATELMLFTSANESHLGVYRTQAPTGPARGIFQCEGNTFKDLYANFLVYHPALQAKINALSTSHTVDDLVNNDAYAIAICRAHYYRVPHALPSASDIEAMWNYYKQYYNSLNGAATHDVAMACWKKYVLKQ